MGFHHLALIRLRTANKFMQPIEYQKMSINCTSLTSTPINVGTDLHGFPSFGSVHLPTWILNPNRDKIFRTHRTASRGHRTATSSARQTRSKPGPGSTSKGSGLGAQSANSTASRPGKCQRDYQPPRTWLTDRVFNSEIKGSSLGKRIFQWPAMIFTKYLTQMTFDGTYTNERVEMGKK